MNDNAFTDPAATAPDDFPLCVVMEARPSRSPWVDEVWSAVGVTAGELLQARAGMVREIFHEHGARRLLYAGFRVRLHADECESYYHNLLAPQPRCYVIADIDESGCPVPLRVTLSFDEAHAYLEGDQEIYAVDMPPELYRWCEGYVLAHYLPQKKRKRKLDNWKMQTGRQHEAT
jgi:hypothetical protein